MARLGPEWRRVKTGHNTERATESDEDSQENAEITAVTVISFPHVSQRIIENGSPGETRKCVFRAFAHFFRCSARKLEGQKGKPAARGCASCR